MANPRRSITVFPTIAIMQGSRGPLIPEYGTPLDRPVLYRFAVNNAETANGWTSIAPSGGCAGNWLDVPEADLGENLADGNATITVAGKRRRRLILGTLTQDSTATLSTTGARLGHRLKFSLLDSGGFAYALVNGGVAAGTLATKASGQRRYVEVYFDATDWVLLDSHAIT